MHMCHILVRELDTGTLKVLRPFPKMVQSNMHMDFKILLKHKSYANYELQTPSQEQSHHHMQTGSTCLVM